MSQKIKELEERQKKLATKIRSLADEFNEKQEWRDSERAQEWETVNEEYNQVRAELDKERNAESIASRAIEVEEFQTQARNVHIPGREDTDSRDTVLGSGVITEEIRSLALQGWMLGADARDNHRTAMEQCNIRSGGGLELGTFNSHQVRQMQGVCSRTHPNLRMNALQNEVRNLNIGTPTAGGHLVSTTLLSNLEINMLFFGPMRQVAETMVTSTGESLSWPTADDTGNEGVILNEATDAGASVDPTFGRVTWGAHKWSSRVIKLSYELIEDGTVNILPIVGDMLGERIGRISNRKFTVGVGTTEPLGIVPASSLGVTAASGTAIVADELINLEHSVDIAYRNGSRYMFHDNLVSFVRKLKDNDGQYLWRPGLIDGVPDKLNGYPLEVNNHMEGTLAVNNIVALFGQLSKYKIRRVNSIRLYHLRELFRMTDEDGFVAFLREDGNLLDAGTAPVRHLQMNAV